MNLEVIKGYNFINVTVVNNITLILLTSVLAPLVSGSILEHFPPRLGWQFV